LDHGLHAPPSQIRIVQLDAPKVQVNVPGKEAEVQE
jgi:hypothetical protein